MGLWVCEFFQVLIMMIIIGAENTFWVVQAKRYIICSVFIFDPDRTWIINDFGNIQKWLNQ